ncbi:MAG: NAD(P)H-dependent oxidoreductase [Candidatus Omnitrophica bacterium]|nr:NAD(P)H-dependent oxidoreductase [Candidatus Omnitrophota bacterium]
MHRLLHIIATPRGKNSSTLHISREFLKVFTQNHHDYEVDELDLYLEELPELTLKRIDGKYFLLSGKDLSQDLQDAWEAIIKQIERFVNKDLYLITTPMWNFSIPYRLKHYIDIIVQPRYLFRYTERGVEGLLKDKKMVIITSRGGDYSGEAKTYDFQESYLRAVFNFVGIKDIFFINAQPMDAKGEKVRKERLEEAKTIACKLAKEI